MNKSTSLAMLSMALFAGCNPAPAPKAASNNQSKTVDRPILAANNPSNPNDWPMWGRTPERQMNTPEKGVPTDWDIESGKNIKWVAPLGSQSYGNPVVAGGLVFVGTNNDGHKDPKVAGDASCLMVFDEKTGKFLFQRVSAKLQSGRVNDWPFMGVCSTACVENDLLWYCTPRCEVVCLDLEPTRRDGTPPKEVWTHDMMLNEGVFPHNMTACSTAVYGDYIYIITGNGVDETHKNIPAPKAPSVICFDKKTGNVKWKDNSPGNGILHGEYSSPAITTVNGRGLVICPLGDGWLYAYDAETGKVVWKFDSNNKDTTYPSTRNELLATPVVVGNLMYIANGQDPEHEEGPGHLWCIDITKTGDVSLELPGEEIKPAEQGKELIIPAGAAKPRKGKPNPNSAVVWDFQGQDFDKNGKIESKERMNRGLSSVAVADGLVFAPDFSGYLHCFDAKTGQHNWTYDTEAAMWGSPMVADGKVFLCNEHGDVNIFPVSKKLDPEKDVITHNMGTATYCSPVFANGTLYIMTRLKLFAISEKK
jgi:outer membrane protein assembly factor BamB